MGGGGIAGLSTFDDEGAVQVVVEAPRGSSIKYAFDPERGVFLAQRALPMGVTYPYDWGFVAGTMGDDGDPVDALVLHRASTYPGVVVPCRTAGMLRISQDARDGSRQANHRVIFFPVWEDAYADVEDVSSFPERMRREIEQFFLSTTFFTAKHARVEGWSDRAASEAFLRQSMKGAATRGDRS